VLILLTCRLAHLSVGLCVSLCVCRSVGLSVGPKVYCGKTADWIQMLFEMMSGVDWAMGVLDGGGDRRRGRGSFEDEFGAFYSIVTTGNFAA